MLNPVHLRTLGVVIARGSFADAARQLGYTPSAVSQQISGLERHLRLSLFEREAHSVRPTAAALEVAERSVPALSTLRALDEDLRLLAGGMTGRLRIGSFPTASQRLLPAALSALRRQRPGVDIQLDEAEPHALMRLLDAGDLDVALVYTYGSEAPRWAHEHAMNPTLVEELLLLSPCQPPGSAPESPDPASLADFADQTWLATHPDTQGAVTVERLCRSAGFEPTVRYRSNNYGVLQGLVRAGMGVAVAPALALDGNRSCAVRRLADPEARRTVSLAFAPGVPSELADAFTAAVRRSASTIVGDFVSVPEHTPGVGREPTRRRQVIGRDRA